MALIRGSPLVRHESLTSSGNAGAASDCQIKASALRIDLEEAGSIAGLGQKPFAIHGEG
jgi:hypothetical protein